MPVGMVVDQPVAQPQHPVKAEIRLQPRFDVPPRQLRIAVGVEQTLLGRHHQPGPVAIQRAPFEDPVGRLHRQPGIVREVCADGLVPVHQVLAAPAVEGEPPRRAPPLGAADHQWPRIAQPDVAIDPLDQLHPGRDEALRPRPVGRIAHHQLHALPALRHGAGETGDLLLRPRQEPGPFLRVVGETDPEPVLGVPFGGHAHDVGHGQALPARAADDKI